MCSAANRAGSCRMLCLGLFLINLEITIVSTAQVSITDEFDAFSQGSWIITAYLITYISGIVIWAKLSDLFGRKLVVLALLIFTAFSGGCAAAQTMVQLIVCRALQGIGGAGTYSLSILIYYELVPSGKYPMYTAISTSVIALATCLGPLLGGVITERASWRWVFLMNVPPGVITAAILFLTIPFNFPHQGRPDMHDQRSIRSTKAVDFPGVFLMLAALALIITGFEQAASLLTWTSATVLAPICISVCLWGAFLFAEWRASRPSSRTEPMFPWRFAQNRVMIGLILMSLTTGSVMVTCIFQLPIRYQVVGGLDPLEAGVRLIPISACGPLGASIGAVFARNERIPPLYLAFAGELMQIIGLVVLSQGTADNPEWHGGIYAIEVVTGLGFGLCIASATLLTPFIVGKKDLAVGSATPVQFRFLGSAMLVSIVTAVGNRFVRDGLLSSGMLAPAQIAAIFESSATIDALPGNLQALVRGYFIEGFNLQMRITLGLAVASVFCTAIMWQKTQIRCP
ncbi:putative multidrug resistance protein fnx1 [Podospora appendiculata]|uniref:Multidrug resistance protein fnx1 n=1 Tax=Podospora appendiculata TaxID=314037 RepID=A0AAE0XAF3_9PEZI|nr:putative multidrug resistance protein fnx1 [Podospora appendiculata]